MNDALLGGALKPGGNCSQIFRGLGFFILGDKRFQFPYKGMEFGSYARVSKVALLRFSYLFCCGSFLWHSGDTLTQEFVFVK